MIVVPYDKSRTPKGGSEDYNFSRPNCRLRTSNAISETSTILDHRYDHFLIFLTMASFVLQIRRRKKYSKQYDGFNPVKSPYNL